MVLGIKLKLCDLDIYDLTHLAMLPQTANAHKLSSQIANLSILVSMFAQLTLSEVNWWKRNIK